MFKLSDKHLGYPPLTHDAYQILSAYRSHEAHSPGAPDLAAPATREPHRCEARTAESPNRNGRHVAVGEWDGGPIYGGKI